MQYCALRCPTVMHWYVSLRRALYPFTKSPIHTLKTAHYCHTAMHWYVSFKSALYLFTKSLKYTLKTALHWYVFSEEPYTHSQRALYIHSKQPYTDSNKKICALLMHVPCMGWLRLVGSFKLTIRHFVSVTFMKPQRGSHAVPTPLIECTMGWLRLVGSLQL